MNLYLSEIYKLFKKEFKNKDKRVHGISIDTRTIQKGEIFIAIKGEKDDGHKYIQDAYKKGSILVVGEKKLNYKNYIRVKSTKEAILYIAKYYFKKFSKNLKVIGVTGSNGKTTTKELIYNFLKSKYKVLKSEKSYNNYLGVPLTIFKLKTTHQILILELGMNKKGELNKLVETIPIDIGIITNIGRAHLGFFKNTKEIAMAKAEIMNGIKKCLILNKDDKYFKFLNYIAHQKKIKVYTVSIYKNATLKFKRESVVNKNKINFYIVMKNKKYNFITSLKGIHNIYNISVAILVSYLFNISFIIMKKQLLKFTMKNYMRFEEIKLKEKGITIINDAYNANPDSFISAINTLKELNYKSLILVIGDMLEQGKYSFKVHRELGEELSKLDLKALLIYGKYKNSVLKGFLNKKGKKYNHIIFLCDTKNNVIFHLKKLLKKGDVVFFKGSRENKLEEVIYKLKKGE